MRSTYQALTFSLKTRYAASDPPQLAQNRDAGASTAAPQCAHASLRYVPQVEQYAGSGSGRGPHVAHERRTER